MEVRTFFDKLRLYPDWNVDLLIEDKQGNILTIKDIAVDETNGNLIIETNRKEK